MSYNNSKNKVLNNSLTKGIRYICLNNCFESLSFAVRTQLQTRDITYTNLKNTVLKKLNFDSKNIFYSNGISEIEFIIPEDSFIDIIKELNEIRSKFLIYLNEFSEYRKNKKLNGRNKTSKKDLEYLKKIENKLIKEFNILITTY